MVDQCTGSCSHPEPEQEKGFAARDYITGDTFAVRRCRRCGLVRTVPAPSPSAMARYYPRTYYGEGDRYNPLVERLLRILYAVRARHLHVLMGRRPGRALDVGCGRGLLLRSLRTYGWTVSGTELSDESATYARDTLGIDVSVGDLSTISFPDVSVDLIILWHVLEHVYDPAATLRRCAQLLVPGGAILVAVPNVGSPEARLGRDVWFHLDVPRHLNHFTPDVLRALLENAGLRVERSRYAAVEYDLFSLVQTVLNRLGFQHNALYNRLRVPGAQPLDRVAPPTRDIVASVALAPIIGLIGGVWTLLAAGTKRGATVTIEARRPDAGHL